MGSIPNIKLAPQQEEEAQTPQDVTTPTEDITNIQTSVAKEEEATLGQVLQGLGYLVHWNIRGCWKPQELQEAIRNAGLSHQVGERGITSAVRSAIGKWKPTKGGVRMRADLVDKNYDDGKSYFISIQQQDADLGNKKASWSQVDYLVLNKATRTWEYEGSSESNDFRSIVTHELNHLYGGDVRYHIIDPIVSALNPIPIGTGMRFIDKSYRDTLLKLHSFIKGIGGGDFHILMQASDKLTKEALKASTEEHITDRLNKVKERLSDYQSKGKIRGDASQNLLSEIAAIASQAHIFGSALGAIQDELDITLDNIRGEIKELSTSSDPKAAERERVKATIEALIETAKKVGDAFMIDVTVASQEINLPKSDGVLSGNIGRAFQELGYFAHKGENYLVLQAIPQC
jgi:flagellin-like hook-associated protein FlgL